MTLLNLNHFWITQPELCLTGTFLKVSFMFVTIFLDIYENPRIRNFIDPFWPKHPKTINWKKKWHKFLFSHVFVVSQNGFIFLRHQKEEWKEKKYVVFTSYSGFGRQGFRLCFCRTLDLYHFRFFNNRDTQKQYWHQSKQQTVQKKFFSKSFYQTKLAYSESYCQILHIFSREVVPGNTSFSLICELVLDLCLIFFFF